MNKNECLTIDDQSDAGSWADVIAHTYRSAV